MIKTYDIDLDDELVECASDIFDNLGTDIDSAIKIFLKQVVLRKGFPFEIVIPNEDAEFRAEKLEAQTKENISDMTESEIDDIHGGITEEEENAAGVAVDAPVFHVSPEIEARVAANEALVAEMRNEIGEKEVTPEFDENEDDGTHGNYEQAGEVENTEAENGKLKPENQETPVVTKSSDDGNVAENAETAADVQESSAADEDDSEDEDETTPDNLFDSWDVGDEEEIGCKQVEYKAERQMQKQAEAGLRHELA